VLDGLRHLLRKERLIRDVEIDPATFAIRLHSDGGDVIAPERLSAGERQLLAVALLWGLARASGRSLPMIVDTPLGRLDSSHRAHLVERYFPSASHQILLLSTDEEINPGYRKKLAPHIGRTYLLVHDDEIGATRIEEGYFW
jgi:DNA sulfur modification protein DndD